MALATVKFWLKSNHSFVDRGNFCKYKNADYEIFKALMSAVYFPVSKHLLTNNSMKENSNNDYVVKVKSVENKNKLGQNLSGLQIYPSVAQNNESESLAERCKGLVGKKISLL